MVNAASAVAALIVANRIAVRNAVRAIGSSGVPTVTDRDRATIAGRAMEIVRRASRSSYPPSMFVFFRALPR
jgi:hypothetical protein